MRKKEKTSNPFPGLRPFHESEQHLFFGRESQIDAMVDKLAANRFLAVVGTSGSGKSSLVNCGLRPALRTGLMANAGTAWRMAQCRPGGDPIAALSKALANDGVLFSNYQGTGISLPEIVDTTLRMGKLGLIDIVDQAQLSEGTNLLLVIDQFEELFRYRHLDEHGEDKSTEIGQQAVAFVNLLLAAIEQSSLPVYVVITMRSDFLGDCAQFPGLAEAINKGQYLVPRMTREQRRAAIAGPIGVGGAKIYPALLTRLVNDVGTNPDQLSILQHALNRTWSHWENKRGRQGMLDIECYDSIGSMTSALDHHANQAFAELVSAEKERICEALFKALTDKASDVRGVRRPTRLDTLCKICNSTQTELESVIDVFRKSSRSFLMPPEGVELHSDTVIDISHESLMRVWKRLDTWADEEADAARMYQRLAETSELYKHENAGLLRDPDLRVALKWQERKNPNAVWAKQYNPDFDGAMAFLEKSEKSDVRRKRLRSGSIAAVLLGLSGFLAYASYDTINDLSAAKEQALVELDEAEQEKINAWNEVEQAKNEALNQVEVSTQQVVVDIEENLTRILTEEVEHLRQAAVQSETETTSVVAKEQIQFFDAIGSLSATQQETIVKYFAQLEADRAELQGEYSEILARYQQLGIQKRIQCEVYSLGAQSDKALEQQQVAYCSENVSNDHLTDDLNVSGDTAGVDCKPNNIPGNVLATLGTQERAFIENRSSQLTCIIEATRQSITDLENGSASLQQEIDRLRDTAPEKVGAIAQTDSSGGNSLPVEPLIASVDSKDKQATKTQSQIQQLPDQQANSDAQQTYLKLFRACESVEKLVPSGCKNENESFLPGKVFVFARVVSRTEDEKLTLQWFENDIDEPFDKKQFTVKPNPDGYRTYTWKRLDKGTYRACMFDQSGQELACISISVGTENPNAIAAATKATTVKATDFQASKTLATSLRKNASGAEQMAFAVEIDQNSIPVQSTGWESTRLEDSEEDGFVVCKDVDKLQPIQCSSELDPGRVYAFARIVTPYEQETITLQWFRDDVEIPELRKELEVKKNSSGFRTYSWNTFDSGSYAVSLSDQSGEELRKISFDVK